MKKNIDALLSKALSPDETSLLPDTVKKKVKNEMRMQNDGKSGIRVVRLLALFAGLEAIALCALVILRFPYSITEWFIFVLLATGVLTLLFGTIAARFSMTFLAIQFGKEK